MTDIIILHFIVNNSHGKIFIYGHYGRWHNLRNMHFKGIYICKIYSGSVFLRPDPDRNTGTLHNYRRTLIFPEDSCSNGNGCILWTDRIVFPYYIFYRNIRTGKIIHFFIWKKFFCFQFIPPVLTLFIKNRIHIKKLYLCLKYKDFTLEAFYFYNIPNIIKW